jgi:hypothetical protein
MCKLEDYKCFFTCHQALNPLTSNTPCLSPVLYQIEQFLQHWKRYARWRATIVVSALEIEEQCVRDQPPLNS